ncbi:MAG: hypothetical protein QOC59_1546 [Microbacteriaceae bacterium]|jgi:hypothetical protein|nr:hypothetical protein [Microbacteriaceae bacterium]
MDVRYECTAVCGVGRIGVPQFIRAMTRRTTRPFDRRGLTLDGCAAFPEGRGGAEATVKVKARLYLKDAASEAASNPGELLERAMREVIQEAAEMAAATVTVKSVAVIEGTTTEAYRARAEAELERNF